MRTIDPIRRKAYLAIFVAVNMLVPGFGRAETVIDANEAAQFTLTLDSASSLKAGEPIRVFLDIKNSTQTVLAGWLNTPEHAEFSNNFVVYGPDGKVADRNSDPPPHAEALGYPEAVPMMDIYRTTFKLAPFQVLRESCVISDIYDMKRPGLYTIQVRTYSRLQHLAESNKVEVRVLP